MQSLKKMNNANFLELLKTNDPEVEKMLSTTFASLRGSAAYWQERKKELDALVTSVLIIFSMMFSEDILNQLLEKYERSIT